MAWYLWVDDDKVGTNCSNLSALSEKSTGFQGGKAAVAKNVNVALRQANLVACALMDVIDSQAVLSYSNSRQQIANQFTTYFNKFATTSGITDGTLVAAKAIQLCANNGTVKLNAGSDDEYILPTTEAGKPKFKLGSGNFKFEEVWSKTFNGDLDGTATRATYASADISKGTIEERLTKLGFRQLPTDRSAGLYVSGASLNATLWLRADGTTRQGNRALALFNVIFGSSTAQVGAMWEFFGNNKEAISSAGFIPVEYRPSSTTTTIFSYRLTYNYANGLHFQTVACMSCTIHGADTEDAGKVTLQVLKPTLTGISTTLSTISILDISVRTSTGYQCKPIE